MDTDPVLKQLELVSAWCEAESGEDGEDGIDINLRFMEALEEVIIVFRVSLYLLTLYSVTLTLTLTLTKTDYWLLSIVTSLPPKNQADTDKDMITKQLAQLIQSSQHEITQSQNDIFSIDVDIARAATQVSSPSPSPLPYPSLTLSLPYPIPHFTTTLSIPIHGYCHLLL